MMDDRIVFWEILECFDPDTIFDAGNTKWHIFRRGEAVGTMTTWKKNDGHVVAVAVDSELFVQISRKWVEICDRWNTNVNNTRQSVRSDDFHGGMMLLLLMMMYGRVCRADRKMIVMMTMRCCHGRPTRDHHHHHHHDYSSYSSADVPGSNTPRRDRKHWDCVRWQINRDIRVHIPLGRTRKRYL